MPPIFFKYIVICGLLPIIVTSSHKHKLVAPVVAQLPKHPIAEPVPVPEPVPVTKSILPVHHSHASKAGHVLPPTTTPLPSPEPVPATITPAVITTTVPAQTANKHDTKNHDHKPKHVSTAPILIPIPVPSAAVPSHHKNDASPNATHPQMKSDNSPIKIESPPVINETKPALSYRLPSNIVPYEYNLWLKVDLDNITFSGHVSIGFTVLKPTSTVTLHYKDINVDWKYSRLIDSHAQKIPFANGSDRFEEEMYELKYKNKLATGNYNLTLSFHGDIRSDLKGLSRYKYRFEGQEK